MRHRLNDITLYYYSKEYSEKDFTIRQNLVSALYLFFSDNYKPKGTTRISVSLRDDEDCIIGYFGSILSVDACFDELNYWKSTIKEQNQIILDTIHRIAILCADKYNWDKSIFEIAYQKTLASGFIYKEEKARKTSKDKNHQASLLIEKNGQNTTISVQFFNKSGELLNTVELLISYPSWFYEEIIKSNKWFNNNEFGLHTKGEELIIKASISSLKSETIFNPIGDTREQLEGYLRNITYKENTDREDYIKWANR